MSESFGKIILGSVQFGMNYGVSNSSGMVSKSKLNAILDEALKFGVDTIDTAFAYGEAHKNLGQFFAIRNNQFKIITKIPDLERSVSSYIKDGLDVLGIDEFHGVLSHNFDLIYKKRKFQKELIEAREKGYTQKIGVSVYDPWQASYILSNFKEVDIVQLPYNIFDQRFSPIFLELKERNIEIHIRSVFLQGMFFLEREVVAERFPNALNYFDKLRVLSEKHKLSMSNLAIKFVDSNPLIDKLVIGCTTPQEFIENIGCQKVDIEFEEVRNELESLEIKDEGIILPINWK